MYSSYKVEETLKQDPSAVAQRHHEDTTCTYTSKQTSVVAAVPSVLVASSWAARSSDVLTSPELLLVQGGHTPTSQKAAGQKRRNWEHVGLD